MALFKVCIERVERYQTEIEIEAPTIAEAISQADDTLTSDGWDALCDNDGEYCDCESSAVSVACPLCGRFFVPNVTGRQDDCGCVAYTKGPNYAV